LAREDDASTRICLLAATARLAHGPPPAEVIVGLTSGDADIRLIAIEALRTVHEPVFLPVTAPAVAVLGDPSCLPQLFESLDSSEEAVVTAACGGLGVAAVNGLDCEPAIGRLTAILTRAGRADDPANPESRVTARSPGTLAAALYAFSASIHDDSGIDAICDVAEASGRDANDKHAISRAICWLGRRGIRSERARQWLLKEIAARKRYLVPEVEALAVFPEEETIDVLFSLLSATSDAFPDAVLKDAAAVALGEMREPAVIPRLREQLKHGSPHTKVWVAAALAKLGDDSGFEELMDAAEERGDGRLEAAVGLGLLGNRKGLAPLRHLADNLDHSNPNGPPTGF
jgi:hypothetical protein